ncbi:hypothetical protein EYF80_020973 [Liparis tanakae]|uniref:Uncharacterized protein n=1 Tax=Liparis tanakae TaxID=230148 RepID=A0A4Z2HTY6_9TELE|nr:hypothetical protein EYF80_020973 [Liparis tanakae]
MAVLMRPFILNSATVLEVLGFTGERSGSRRSRRDDVYKVTKSSSPPPRRPPPCVLMINRLPVGVGTHEM